MYLMHLYTIFYYICNSETNITNKRSLTLYLFYSLYKIELDISGMPLKLQHYIFLQISHLKKPL